VRPPAAPARARTGAAFDPDGPLARTVDGFVARASQQQMALAVHDAIAAGGTLIAEAGTGTGKTFAYLVPALVAGGKVLVSTGTKPLQDQLFRKDLPAVQRALGLNVHAALLKGRANYLCLHRMERAGGESLLATRQDVAHLRTIRRFASATATGDRAELGAVPENAAVWPLVTSTRENCLGAECPRYSECFVFKARREAQAADVVVVNHHLFLADLALRDDAVRDFLPAVDTVILDEAHQLPSIAADFFGVTLSLAQRRTGRPLARTCARSRRRVVGGARERLRARGARPASVADRCRPGHRVANAAGAHRAARGTAHGAARTGLGRRRTGARARDQPRPGRRTRPADPEDG
jgi:ATP-dependent DNA helicase DinG